MPTVAIGKPRDYAPGDTTYCDNLPQQAQFAGLACRYKREPLAQEEARRRANACGKLRIVAGRDLGVLLLFGRYKPLGYPLSCC